MDYEQAAAEYARAVDEFKIICDKSIHLHQQLEAAELELSAKQKAGESLELEITRLTALLFSMVDTNNGQ